MRGEKHLADADEGALRKLAKVEIGHGRGGAKHGRGRCGQRRRNVARHIAKREGAEKIGERGQVESQRERGQRRPQPLAAQCHHARALPPGLLCAAVLGSCQLLRLRWGGLGITVGAWAVQTSLSSIVLRCGG